MATNSHGYEISRLSPGWIHKTVPESYADDVLKDLILFYVINTPCENLSSSLPLSKYGWNKDVWKKGKLKTDLLKVANLKKDETFFVAHHTNEMKSICNRANLTKGFHKNRTIERVAIYKGQYNEFMSVLYHIRNAFAHGRLAMYPDNDSDDIIFVLEDGIKKKGDFQVRSRMVLKRTTLKKWMDIIKNRPNQLDT